MPENSKLYLVKHNTEGDMAHEYQPLFNKVDSDNNIVDFRTTEIQHDLHNPANIECQPSYDGTVNIIINDDKNPPRIVNTRYSRTEDNRYRIINRNQLQQTNLYNEAKIDAQTRLFRNVDRIPKIKLSRVNYYGQLKGGNYTFYVKFADNDYNKTDVVCESGMVSIYKGTLNDIKSISGTLADERTDKAIQLLIENIDTTFSKVYLYYTRDTSDMLGAKVTETVEITRPYEIKGSTLYISLNGFEDETIISSDEINIKYNLVTAVKTQAQVQNMLFFGNVQGVEMNYNELQNISYFIKVGLRQSGVGIDENGDKTVDTTQSLGFINENYKQKSNEDISQSEYYNPLNIYYKLGYWPGEIYRLGIVYQMTDDSLSPVFNLRGHKFIGSDGKINPNEWNYDENISKYGNYINPSTGEINYIPTDEFIEDEGFLDNTKGVFRNPDDFSVIDYDKVGTFPFYYKIELSAILQQYLAKYKVKGFFIVRQPRIPITLCQGLSIATDKTSFVPMLFDDSSENSRYISESFISNYTDITKNVFGTTIKTGFRGGTLTTDYASRKIGVLYKQSSGLLSLDANVNPILQSMLDGTQYTLQKIWKGNLANNKRQYWLSNYTSLDNWNYTKVNAIFINSDVPLKYVNDIGFSTRAGSAESAKSFGFFGSRDFKKENSNLIRGVFVPFVGITNNVEDNCIYNLRIQNYSSVFEKEYFQIRTNDNSSFFAISDRFELTPNDLQTIDVYRGDCYTATVSMRLQINFVDSDAPVNETIVDPDTWSKNYNGYNSTDAEKWLDINRADLNTVPIGTWVTFKCLSNYNLGLRSQDRSYTDEMALMGNPRSFYPLNSASVSVSNKIEESWLLNGGLSSTLGKRRNFSVPNVPYIKDLFDNRIMFSNVQIADDFRNAYRIFQGLSYQDIDRQYGAIVKLIPWGVNLFCVFEHGLAIVPINEKALIYTNTGQSIHMYGSDVIQNQVTLISPDYGSIWPESVIRTPVGIYGIDTYAKKIWRFSDEKGLELLSDMKVQRFLNDHIMLAELDKYPTVALKNVKTHFNNYKGDVMFTFYNDDKDTEWSLCYNERLDKWITRYSWTPLYSGNVNNVYYSLDKKRAEILAYAFDNQNVSVGLRLGNGQNEWSDLTTNFSADIKIAGYDFYSKFNYNLNRARSSYMDENQKEIFVDIPLTYFSVDTTKNRVLISDVPVGFSGFYDSYIDSDGERVYDMVSYSTVGNYYVMDSASLPNDLYWSTTKTDAEEGSVGLAYAKVPGVKIVEWILNIDKNALTYDGHQLYYIKLNTSVTPTVSIDGSPVTGNTFTQNIGIIAKRSNLTVSQQNEYDKLLINGFYVHGQAGIFNEMNNFDNDPLNNIQPTKWYDKQEPFEFEFVVNNITGFHKIFNDLVIISNNVQPKEFDFEIIGDVYDFNKAGIYQQEKFGTYPGEYEFDGKINLKQTSQEFKNVNITWDHVLNQYSLVTHQPALNMKTAGRLRGNIHYKEDAWYLVIEPIKYYKKNKTTTATEPTTVRIRDKFLKVRVKYSGENLAIITALKTFMTLSYS